MFTLILWARCAAPLMVFVFLGSHAAAQSTEMPAEQWFEPIETRSSATSFRFGGLSKPAVVSPSGIHLDTGRQPVDLVLRHANASARVDAQGELDSHSHYYSGQDSTRWRHNVPHYSRIRYHDVYEGVDLVYYERDGRLEYDFTLEPGADPRVIEWEFKGSYPQLVSEHEILLAGSGVRLTLPATYQTNGTKRIGVDARFIERRETPASLRSNRAWKSVVARTVQFD